MLALSPNTGLENEWALKPDDMLHKTNKVTINIKHCLEDKNITAFYKSSIMDFNKIGKKMVSEKTGLITHVVEMLDVEILDSALQSNEMHFQI